MRQFLKTWMLPISMIGGLVFHEWMGYLKPATPYLIFVMLLVTYTRINPQDFFKISKFHWALLSVQIFGAWVVYLLLLPMSQLVASGAFLCVFISTATSAPVITSMLGGSIPRLVSYSFLSNFTLALLAPLFLPLLNKEVEITFLDSFEKIASEVLPLLILPIIVALIIRYSLPKLHKVISTHQSISFYLWSVALFIVVGSSVSFIIKQPLKDIPEMGSLALAAGIVCCLQFYIGRKIGKRYGDKISGAQGLGQKNTILAIWLALTYLNPITSIAPAAYVGWQNIINSMQLYFRAKNNRL